MNQTGKDVSLNRLNAFMAFVIVAMVTFLEFGPEIAIGNLSFIPVQSKLVIHYKKSFTRKELISMPYGDYLRGKTPDEYGVWR